MRRTKIASFFLALLTMAIAAGTAAAQEASRPGGKLAVFPLEGVNVQPNIVVASTEVLKSALRNQGFDIVDWEESLVTVAAPPAPPQPGPLPPPPPPDPYATTGTTDPAAQPQPLVAVPPPAPPAPAVAPPSPPPAAGPVVLTTAKKAEIARNLGCIAYIDGMLVRLGTKVRVSINKRDLDGKVIDDRQTEAKSEDDLVGVLERIAMAFAGDKTVDETLNLDNATMAEAQRRSNRFRLEKNFGAMIGGAFGINQTMDTAGMLVFDARLEIKDLLLIINAGLGFAADDGYDDYDNRDSSDTSGDDGTDYTYKKDGDANVTAFVDVSVAYYLSHTGVAPYLGAGVGVFFGGRVHDKGDKASLGDTTQINGWDEPPMDSEIGFELFPVLGLELLRQTSIRVHLEFRYSLNFGSDSAFGHGPVAFAGVDF